MKKLSSLFLGLFIGILATTVFYEFITADQLMESSGQAGAHQIVLEEPVIYFSRPGLVSAEVREEIKEKFALPKIECLQKMEPSNPVLAILIEIPVHDDEPYSYNLIQKEGHSAGLYGIKGEPVPEPPSSDCSPEAFEEIRDVFSGAS